MHSHITKEIRIELAVLLRAGFSLRASARILGVHHTSLARELQRNQVRGKQAAVAGYHAIDAQIQTNQRRNLANQRFRKILPGSRVEQLLVDKISIHKWAPEQCAGWLKTYMRSLYVCAQTIYDWIYRSRSDLVTYLHCAKGKYRRTRQARLRKDKRAELATPRNIAARPQYIQLRKTYGHWEGDTVHGTGKTGYIATFVERKSGYLMAMLLPTPMFSSLGFANAANHCLSQVPFKHRKTLTLDNGPEMKLPEQIERTTGTQVYYANPYHSWERGTNENTNGLLRYFFPKKSSFATLTQEDIDLAVNLINTRPRKRLNWRTPAQMLKV